MIGVCNHHSSRARVFQLSRRLIAGVLLSFSLGMSSVVAAADSTDSLIVAPPAAAIYGNPLLDGLIAGPLGGVDGPLHERALLGALLRSPAGRHALAALLGGDDVDGPGVLGWLVMPTSRFLLRQDAVQALLGSRLLLIPADIVLGTGLVGSQGPLGADGIAGGLVGIGWQGRGITRFGFDGLLGTGTLGSAGLLGTGLLSLPSYGQVALLGQGANGRGLLGYGGLAGTGVVGPSGLLGLDVLRVDGRLVTALGLAKGPEDVRAGFGGVLGTGLLGGGGLFNTGLLALDRGGNLSLIDRSGRPFIIGDGRIGYLPTPGEIRARLSTRGLLARDVEAAHNRRFLSRLLH